MHQSRIAEFHQIPLISETELKSSWLKDGPQVSIVCTTFNHEKYLEDAIRGFLIQKTEFPFEIILHDDASTDGTRDIIRRYAEAYPTIIKPVYQSENQYSKGVLMLLHAASYATGEFVAFCEGDDYWLDSDKLQTQVDTLQRFPQADICFHAAIKTIKEQVQPLLFCRRGEGECMLDVRAIIREGGSFMPTAAMLLRTSFFDRIGAETTDFYRRNLDAYFFQIFASLRGGAVYIDRPMSVYRSFSEGSWTQTVNQDQTFYKKWAVNYLEALRETDNMTGHVHGADIIVSIRRCHLSVLNNNALDLNFRRDYFNQHRKELGLYGALLWHGVFRMPRIHTRVKKARALLQAVRTRQRVIGGGHGAV